MNGFLQRLTGALYGVAIGDGMGAPVEGWPPTRIVKAFPARQCAEFLPATHGGDPSTGKGFGRITDDTLMVEALIRAYGRRCDHMDAYDFESYFLPEVAETEVWLPERQRQMAILERLFWPERYPWIKLTINRAEPRTAGNGNLVNCGVAMYMMPIGAVNAGDPRQAYQEAVLFGSAHNESYALEAAAVMAACYSEAFAKGSTPASAAEHALQLAKDGTREAIQAALAAVNTGHTIDEFVAAVRKAVASFDQRTGHTPDDIPLKPDKVCDAGRPSRLASIEELPVALAALLYGQDDFQKVLTAAVYYGRDCDSIASMACGLFGALQGIHNLPSSLCKSVDEENRRSFENTAKEFGETISQIMLKDSQRQTRREQTYV